MKIWSKFFTCYIWQEWFRYMVKFFLSNRSTKIYLWSDKGFLHISLDQFEAILKLRPFLHPYFKRYYIYRRKWNRNTEFDVLLLKKFDIKLKTNCINKKKQYLRPDFIMERVLFKKIFYQMVYGGGHLSFLQLFSWIFKTSVYRLPQVFPKS